MRACMSMCVGYGGIEIRKYYSVELFLSYLLAIVYAFWEVDL